MEDTHSTYTPSDIVPGIEHYRSGVSHCGRCNYRLILMSDDDGEGGSSTDVHTYADCDINRGADVHTWADSYGLWHARVTVSRESDVTPRIMARNYILDEIAQRESTPRDDIRFTLVGGYEPEHDGNIIAYHFYETAHNTISGNRFNGDHGAAVGAAIDRAATEMPDIIDNLMADTWDGGDPWGSAVEAQFCLEYLALYAGVPTHPEFRSPMGLPDDDEAYLYVSFRESYELGAVDDDDIVTARAALETLAGTLDRAGLSY